jgi:hypothetical protein
MHFCYDSQDEETTALRETVQALIQDIDRDLAYLRDASDIAKDEN